MKWHVVTLAVLISTQIILTVLYFKGTNAPQKECREVESTTIIQQPCPEIVANHSHVNIGCKKLSLKEELATIDWKEFEDFVKEHPGEPLPSHLISKYAIVVSPFIDLEPEAPPRVTKRPKELELKVDCRAPKFRGIFTGAPKNTSVKVYDFVPIGHEVDILEIRLYELNDVVDKFILIESTKTHRFAHKPLFLARNLDSARFAPFRDKIVHILVDDIDALHFSQHVELNQDDWRLERAVRKLMWKKFVDAFGEPGPEDILIHGDLDEIPDSSTIYNMKHCELLDTPINLLSTFYRLNFDWVPTYNPVLQYPTILRKKDVIPEGGFVREMPVLMFAPAGAHMNRFGSPEVLIYKHLAMAEGGTLPRGNLSYLKDPSLIQPFLDQGLRECCEDPVGHTRHPEPSDEPWIPWFADYNRDRFKYMFPLRVGNPWTAEDKTLILKQ